MFREHWKDRLWSMEYFFHSRGIRIQTRMTVVRLSDQSLFLHSPVRLTKQLQGRLEVLGPVHSIVSPNKFHHVFLEDYFRVYPNAKIYASPGLDKKRKDWHFDAILRDSPEPHWKEDLDQIIFWGTPVLEEVVFFHRASKTLISADLCCNITREAALVMKMLARLSGSYKRVSAGPILKWCFINRQVARQSLEKILNWDFERIILAHGKILDEDGKGSLRRAYAWLLKNGV